VEIRSEWGGIVVPRQSHATDVQSDVSYRHREETQVMRIAMTESDGGKTYGRLPSGFCTDFVHYGKFLAVSSASQDNETYPRFLVVCILGQQVNYSPVWLSRGPGVRWSDMMDLM
jgi:hypothetical protein